MRKRKLEKRRKKKKTLSHHRRQSRHRRAPVRVGHQHPLRRSGGLQLGPRLLGQLVEDPAAEAREQAQAKAKQIREQALVTIEQEKNQIVRQNQEDIKRLSILQQETLQLEQQKAQNELAQKLVRLALHQVREKLTQRLNSSIHSAVNNFQIVLFTNYKA